MATSIPTPPDAVPSPQPRQDTLVTVSEQVAALDEILRRARTSKIEIIVHETRWIESSCPHLMALLRSFGDRMTIYVTGPEARGASDPLVLVDGRHFLHRFHVDQPRALLAIESPHLAGPLVNRFEEIWATGEAGLSGTVLGI